MAAVSLILRAPDQIDREVGVAKRQRRRCQRSDCRPEEEGTETGWAQWLPVRVPDVPIVAPKKGGLKQGRFAGGGFAPVGSDCRPEEERTETVQHLQLNDLFPPDR